MTSKKNLGNRVDQAQRLAEMAVVLHRDPLERVNSARIPSFTNAAKRYDVDLSWWDGQDLIVAVCQCYGNRGDTVCKHVLAAIILSEEGRSQPHFYADEADAETGKNDRVFCLAGQGTGKLFVVLERREPPGYRAMPHDWKRPGSRMFK